MATNTSCSSGTSGAGKVPVILDGTFFKVVSVDGDKVIAKCTKCISNKTYSGLLSATTNFLTHLKVSNPGRYGTNNRNVCRLQFYDCVPPYRYAALVLLWATFVIFPSLQLPVMQNGLVLL